MNKQQQENVKMMLHLNKHYFMPFQDTHEKHTKDILFVKLPHSLLQTCLGPINAVSWMLERFVQSLKSIVLAVFILELVKCSPPRKLSLAK